MDDEHYATIEQLRGQLDLAEQTADDLRDKLHAAIRDAFPETAGGEPKRGVLAEVARRSKFSREYVAQIRDGKAGS